MGGRAHSSEAGRIPRFGSLVKHPRICYWSRPALGRCGFGWGWGAAGWGSGALGGSADRGFGSGSSSHAEHQHVHCKSCSDIPCHGTLCPVFPQDGNRGRQAGCPCRLFPPGGNGLGGRGPRRVLPLLCHGRNRRPGRYRGHSSRTTARRRGCRGTTPPTGQPRRVNAAEGAREQALRARTSLCVSRAAQGNARMRRQSRSYLISDFGALLFQGSLDLVSLVARNALLDSSARRRPGPWASLRPRPVSSRTTWMTGILFGPTSDRTALNSVCSSAAAGVRACVTTLAAARQDGDGRRGGDAVTPRTS